MKKIYKLIFSLFVVFLFKCNVSAINYGNCDYATVANLKDLVNNNIDISYSYEIRNNIAYFHVTLNNVPHDVYFKDTYSNKIFQYSDTNNGEITIRDYTSITKGHYTFYVNNGICNGVKLGSKYYKFPIYNTRMNDEACKDIPNFYMCKKWISEYYSSWEFEEKIKEYKENLENASKLDDSIKYKKDLFGKIIDFYIKYYYYIFPIIIIIGVIIIVISNRKNKFEL